MVGAVKPINSPAQVLFASLIGTTIEFFDFYIYATAAVLVFPRLFFPASDPASATLASLATFAIAFVARPIGSALFGHFGDRVGRKTTLVAALLTMGLSTVSIGALPTYGTIGIAAPILLALFRFGQGLGLGGEWGGAVLLAVENAPPGKRAWYGMFPQLGAPIGFLFSGGIFLLLSAWLTNEQFFAFGWRLPFLASSVLVLLGLYVRLTITETPVFQEALSRRERVDVPMLTVLRDHTGTVVLGVLVSLTAFVTFYLMTVFALSWGTSALGYSREKFLVMQLVRDPVLRAVHADLRGSRRAGPAPHADRGERRDLHFWPGPGPDVRRRHDRRGADDGARHEPGGSGVRTARHRALRALSDDGALLGQLADVQPGRASSARRSRRTPPRISPRRTGCSTSATTCRARRSCRLPDCSPRAKRRTPSSESRAAPVDRFFRIVLVSCRPAQARFSDGHVTIHVTIDFPPDRRSG